MNTQFPYGKIDYDRYLDQYLEREDAIRSIPRVEECIALARKTVVREHITLALQPEGTMVETGDTLTISTESTIPRFNRERITLSPGRGLYSKEIERDLIGKRQGDVFSSETAGTTVKVTVLEIKRKTVPEPTDEMVVEMQVKDNMNNMITTVSDYEKFTVGVQTDIRDYLGEHRQD